MKTWKEMTMGEVLALDSYRQKKDYDSNEIADMINIGRQYVNQNITYCSSCRANLAEAKKEIFQWFGEFRGKIVDNINHQADIIVEEIIEENLTNSEKAVISVKKYSKDEEIK